MGTVKGISAELAGAAIKEAPLLEKLEGASVALIDDYKASTSELKSAKKALDEAKVLNLGINQGPDTVKKLELAQENFNAAQAEAQKLEKLTTLTNEKGAKAAFELAQNDPVLSSSPAVKKWMRAAQPVLAQQLASKIKAIGLTSAGVGLAGAGFYAWFHTNPPSIYAKDVKEALAALENVKTNGDSQKLIDVNIQGLQTLASITSENEDSIMRDPAKAEAFVSNLAGEKENIDSSLKAWGMVYQEAEDINAAKKAYKELKDVSTIIGSRLKSLGDTVGIPVDAETPSEAPTQEQVKSDKNNNSDSKQNDLSKIQAYLQNSYPRVKPTGEMDEDTQTALNDIESRLEKISGKNFSGVLSKASYADFMRVINILKNNGIEI